jgi:hypothetical protein
MHDAKTDTVFVEDRLEHAANRAFLGPDLDALRLLKPEIESVGTRDASNEGSRRRLLGGKLITRGKSVSAH